MTDATPPDWFVTPPSEPVDRKAMSAPAPRPKGRGTRALGWVVVAATVLAAAVGIAALVQASRTDARARDARRRTAITVTARRRVATAIDATNHLADTPIGKAEQVANALSKIDEVAGNVLIESHNVEDVLGRAVDRENSSPGSGRSLYEGEGGDAVRRMQEVLRGAQVTLAAAVQSAAELEASAT